MSFFDMFDKIDDIIYKPVETICEWTKEPLKRWEHQRDMETQSQNIEAEERARRENHQHEMEKAQKTADNEMAKKRLDQALTEEERKSVTEDMAARAKIDADIRKWNAEIDQMILREEDARRDRLVECMKRYQIDLSNAARDIVNSIGMMSLELRERANQLVIERTKDYIAIQEKAKDNAMNRLEEIGTRFANNERVRIRMEDSVINNMDSIINQADKFITEISEDFKRLNQNTDELMRIGLQNAGEYIKPMANGLGVTLPTIDIDTTKRIENR